MNKTRLGLAMGALLVVVLGVLGIASWSWIQGTPNMTNAPMRSMMQGWGMSNMQGQGMMGPMGSMMHQGGGMMMGMGGGHGCCGHMTSNGATVSQPATALETNAVELNRLAINPSVIKVSRATTVTWTNRDSVPHTIAANDGSFRSGLLQPGQSWSFTFDKSGTYSYYCEPHPFMQGQVIVEDKAEK
jgi:plastocyanin